MLPQVIRFRKWLRRKSPQASTYIHYCSDLTLFFTWADKPPEAITIYDIDRYIDHCQQLGHAVNTINRRLTAIRSFYHFLAFEPGDAPSNPVLLKRHWIRQGQRLPRDVQDADIESLFAVIHSARDRSMLLLMLRCGLRVGEVHSLSMHDLYLKPSQTGLPRLWINGKNDAQRVVYVSHQALQALRDWLAIRPATAGTDAVYLSRLGRRISVRSIQDRLALYCEQAGVHFSCHQLRHTFGRHLHDAGVPITSIQRLLGHARLSTTRIYVHISDPKVRADYEAGLQKVLQRLALEEG